MTVSRIPVLFRALLAGLCLFAGRPAAAADTGLLPPVVGTSERLLSHSLAGLGLDGFDPVTYFLPGGPRSGSAEHEVLWNGIAWRFASEANLEAFLADPTVYAPRLGGHDPEGAARGRFVDGDARLSAVIDGRLYLFHSPRSRERVLATPSLVATAEAAWPELSRTLVAPEAPRPPEPPSPGKSAPEAEHASEASPTGAAH